MTIVSIVLGYAFALFALAITLTALFGPWLAFGLKALEINGKKPFLGLVSRQAARMNLWFGGLFAILVLSSLFQGFFRLRQVLPPQEMLQSAVAAGTVTPPDAGMMIAVTAAFTVFIVLLAAAHFSWKNLRARPAVQALLLFMSAAGGWAALALAFHIVVSRPQILNTYYYLSIFTWTGSMYPFGFPTPESSAMMIVKFISGGLGVAAAMCMCCSLIFRKRDDFGRDYYNFAIRHLARWNLVCTAVTMLAGLGMMLTLRRLIAPRFDMGLNDIILTPLIYVSCGVFWWAIMRSLTPLRHKFGIWLGLVALLVAMLGHLLFVRNFFVAVGMMSGALPFN